MTSSRALALSSIAVFAGTLPCGVMSAQPLVPKFQPGQVNSGILRTWGNDAMHGVMAAWQRGFRVYHPGVRFEQSLFGSGTGMAGIITGTSDLALMGRPVTPNEVIGFEWVFRYKPLQIQVLNGDIATDKTPPGRSPALAVYVALLSPLSQVTMEQLASILGCPGSASAPVSWSRAGASGAFATHPVHAYVFDSETGTGAFLQQAVLGEGDRWNWNVVHEFRGITRADGTVYPASRQILDALRKDPDGLAISAASFAAPGVKMLALGEPSEAVLPTRPSIIAGTYPLARGVYIDINRKPGTPISPLVKEFLNFILSAEGQDIARREGSYLPLSAKLAREQQGKLE